MTMQKDLAMEVAFELVSQGIWDQEDLARFVLDRVRRSFDRGYQTAAMGIRGTPQTLAIIAQKTFG